MQMMWMKTTMSLADFLAHEKTVKICKEKLLLLFLSPIIQLGKVKEEAFSFFF